MAAKKSTNSKKTRGGSTNSRSKNTKNARGRSNTSKKTTSRKNQKVVEEEKMFDFLSILPFSITKFLVGTVTLAEVPVCASSSIIPSESTTPPTHPANT